MTKIIIIVACVVVGLGILTAGLSQVYKSGQDQVRAETLTKAVELVKERDALNVKVKTATPADVCSRLGGKWLPDTNECS